MSKVYRTPDTTISKHWISDDGCEIILDTNRGWIEVDSGRHIQVNLHKRWMPFEKPVFPLREKMPMRLCTARHIHRGVVETFVYMPFLEKKFWSTNAETCVEAYLRDIVWISPEYKDEVP